MARFVLVHGASHAAWCWEKLIPELQALGHEAVAFDLPAHGADETPAATVSMKDYVASVVSVLGQSDKPSILVAHSMGGLAATGAAEAEPDSVAALVYVTAYAPTDGDSVGSILAGDPDTQVPAATELAEGGAAVQVADARVIPIFYNDCSPADAAAAKARLVPEPAAPLGEAVALSAERAGRVPKLYVGCTDDQCIAIAYQRKLAERSGSRWLGEIASGHSPFLTRPAELARLLASAAS